MAMFDEPTLPDDAILDYLAEGAANIVFRIKLDRPQDDPLHDVFKGKLLRLRKDLPTTLPSSLSHQLWEKRIVPLFSRDQLVDQSLVQILPTTLHRLNAILASLAARPAIRRGPLLAMDTHGLLVTDMTPESEEEVLFEFKPKWLVQSPTAPPGSVRCRQCASNARVNVERVMKGLPFLPHFCPLDLFANEIGPILHAVYLMNPPFNHGWRLARWIQQSSLLRRLRLIQRDPNFVGVLGDEPPGQNLLMAMTLRDCSVYIKFPADPMDDCYIEPRIGDLDVKSPEKADYWKQTEQRLIDGGFYQATGFVGFPEDFVDCALATPSRNVYLSRWLNSLEAKLMMRLLMT